MDASLARGGGELWAITTYFNPIGWRSRLANYRMFRQHLKMPLIAVELAYRSDFELQAGDAEILIQLRGRDVMWQKERLLNIALKALPETCRLVTWLDCDIVFANDDWPEAAARLLDRFALVQLFGRVHWMPPGWSPGNNPTQPMDSLRSIAFLVASGMPAAYYLEPFPPDERLLRLSAPGQAWAARRETIEHCGFYDECIIGGGDRAMNGAAFGYIEQVARRQYMTERHARAYSTWARRCCDAIGGSVGCLDGDLFHLWHGRFANRHYRDRHAALSRFQFDPLTDIALDQQGCWRWNSDKPGLHKYVRDFFASRQEDG